MDFISIGTNDLTQYTLAAERRNAGVAAPSDPLDLGVLRLIRHVCHTAGDTVTVAVCGEAAADHTAIPVLIGLGIRELSVSPKAVPSVKAGVRALDLARCASLAEAAINLDDAASSRRLASSSLDGDDKADPGPSSFRRALDADLHITQPLASGTSDNPHTSRTRRTPRTEI